VFAISDKKTCRHHNKQANIDSFVWMGSRKLTVIWRKRLGGAMHMSVESYLSQEIWHTVSIMPLKHSKTNPICRRTYGDLYYFFDNYDAESYHTLIQDVNLEIMPEMYVLINDTGLDRDGLAAEFSYKVTRAGRVLTWYLLIYDITDNPLNVPFIYDLAGRGTSFELLKMKEAQVLRVYFLERMPDGGLNERYYATLPKQGIYACVVCRRM